MNALALSALSLGFFGSVHCFAMCGGVVGAICSACPSAPRRHWIAYNAGRIASYALIGAIGGALGSNLVRTEEIRVGLRVIAALCMLAAGLQLVGLPAGMKRIESIGAPVWRRIEPLVGRWLRGRTAWHAMGVGAAWGFMPCGVLYAAFSLAASSGSASGGATTMLLFGAATLPAIFAMVFAARRLTSRAIAPRMRRFAGVAILGFGVYSAAGTILQLESPLICCLRR